MRLSAPKKFTWSLAVIIGILGILGKFIAIPYLSVYACWLLLIAFVILALASYVKGL